MQVTTAQIKLENIPESQETLLFPFYTLMTDYDLKAGELLELG
jgi:hypothetical protein